MRLGSKGDMSWVVILIIVIVVGMVLIYLVFIRGLNPFSVRVESTECVSQLVNACNSGAINTDFTNVEKRCGGMSEILDACRSCITSSSGCSLGSDNFKRCCDWARQTKTD